MSLSLLVAALLIAQTQATTKNTRDIMTGQGIVEAVVQSTAIEGQITLGTARVEKVFTGKQSIQGMEFVIQSVVDENSRGEFTSNKIYPLLEVGERIIGRVNQYGDILVFNFSDYDYFCGIKVPQRQKLGERFEELKEVLIDIHRIESGPDDEALKLLKTFILSPNIHFVYWSGQGFSQFGKERPAMVQEFVPMLRSLLDDPDIPTVNLLYIDGALAANDGSWRRSDERIKFMIRLISNGFSDETKTGDQKFGQRLEKRFSGNFSDSRFELEDALKLLEALLNDKQISKKQRAILARLELVNVSELYDKLEPLLLILTESSHQELRWFAARNLTSKRLNDKQLQDIQQISNAEKDLDIRPRLDYLIKEATAKSASPEENTESK